MNVIKNQFKFNLKKKIYYFLVHNKCRYHVIDKTDFTQYLHIMKNRIKVIICISQRRIIKDNHDNIELEGPQ